MDTVGDRQPSDRDGADDRPADAAAARASSLSVSREADRFSTALVAIVSLGYAAITYVGILQNVGGTEAVLSTVYAVALVVLQLGYFSRPGARLTPVRSAFALTAFAALTYLPLLQLGSYWSAFNGFLAGCLLIALPLRWGLGGYLLVLVGSSLVERRFGADDLEPTFAVTYAVSATAVTGLVIFGLTRLARVVRELHEAREELTRMAVAEERVRFSRDAHDLLGMSLSTITLKAELANGLVLSEPHRAHAEIAEVITTARRALGEVRMVAAGYTTLSLPEELWGAQAVLQAAEIDTSVHGADVVLPAEVGSLFGTLVREAATNVLRHSKAEVCHMAVTRERQSVRMAISNDRAGEEGESTAERPPCTRRGIANLRQRFAEQGGTLTVRHEDDEFIVVGVLPTGGPD
jgi:two-component system, NarL family, sensor histidine kinase DesK